MTKNEGCKGCGDCDCGNESQGNKASPQESKQSEQSTESKEYSEIKETLQRVYAEYQNYKRRTEEERKKTIELSNEDMIKRMLPIVDNLELALMNKKHDDEFSKAIELIYAQFVQMLEDEGVKRILSSGKFDPRLHEVLLTETSDKEDGVIIEEFQRGYTLGGKILRHSKVKISKQNKA